MAARETRVENAMPEVIHFGRSGTIASILLPVFAK